MRTAPWLAALAEVFAPLGGGFLLGAGLRRILRFGPVWILSWALVGGLSLLAASTSLRVGVWDGALMAILLLLGVLGGGITRFAGAWREVLTVLAGGVGGLLLIEVGVRLFLPPPPSVPPPESAHFFIPRVDLVRPVPAHGDHVFTPRHLVDACAYLYPERYPDHWQDRVGRRPRGVPATGAVLHLGDSMTMGLGVSIDQAFPAVLESRQPELIHLNGAMASMSLDYEFVIARHWLDRSPWPVKLVVLNLFYNDPLEIDQAMPCCDEQPLLTYPGDRVQERCPQPVWPAGYGASPAWLARYSAPPYPLRVATAISSAARYLDAWLVSLTPFAPPPPEGERDPWGHFEAVFRALRDDLKARQVPLVAVLMPIRGVLEGRLPGGIDAVGINRQLGALARDLGVPVLEAAEAFPASGGADDISRYFLGRDDIHLSAEGHLRLAAWLEPRLAPHLR